MLLPSMDEYPESDLASLQTHETYTDWSSTLSIAPSLAGIRRYVVASCIEHIANGIPDKNKMLFGDPQSAHNGLHYNRKRCPNRIDIFATNGHICYQGNSIWSRCNSKAFSQWAHHCCSDCATNANRATAGRSFIWIWRSSIHFTTHWTSLGTICE